MPVDPQLAYVAENGFQVSDAAGFFSGSEDPTVAGVDAAIGSFFARTNGQQYRKTGALATDWTPTDTATNVPSWVLAFAAAHG